MNPTVSVIIPTYNRANLVSRAIKSVLNQTYQDFEIIVVDDCSEDNTEEIVKSFNDSRIRYIKHKKNKGGSAARNTGIKRARGKYIAFLDDDDEWLPSKLEKQIMLFEKLSKHYGVVYSGYYIAKGDVIKRKVLPKYRGDVYGYLLKRNFIGSPTIVVRKECFKRAGLFDEDLPASQDWDMWLRIAKYYKFEYILEPLAIYYTNGSYFKLDKYIISLEKILNKYYQDFCRNPKVLSNMYKYLGILYFIIGDKKKATNLFIKSIDLKLLQNSYIHILLSIIFPKIYKKLITKRI